MELQDLDRRAVLRGVDIVSGVKPAHLDLPTPCGQWSLRALLEHMIVQHNGFAAAARGVKTELSAWRPVPLGADPAAEYAAAAERVITAFGESGVLDRRFWLPEIRDGGPFPARMAIGFHLVDYVAHGWDVAVTLGVGIDFDQDILDAATEIARQVPGGAARRAPGAAFGPEIPLPDNGSTLDSLLASLGRSPAWPGG